MRVNMNIIKVMISRQWQKVTQKARRWPCGVCVIEALVIIQYSVLVVTKCSGIKGSMYKVIDICL